MNKCEQKPHARRLHHLLHILALGSGALLGACGSGIAHGSTELQDAGLQPEASAPEDGSATTDAALPPDASVQLVTISTATAGFGAVTPSEPQTAAPGESVVFTLQPRIAACVTSVGGDCAATLDSATNQVEVVATDQDCELAVTFDCGTSSVELRPEHIGVLWDNQTQQFTATQIFATGERVDISGLVDWSSSDNAVVSVSNTGLATTLVNHGIVEITAQDPSALEPLAATTDLTVVNVTHWENIDCTNWDTGTVYLHNVVFSASAGTLTWDWTPVPPWTPHPNTVIGRLWYFWSEDGGLTFSASAWDWIGTLCFKQLTNLHTLSPWMGVMVSAAGCTPSGWCNETDRSNIYFTPGF